VKRWKQVFLDKLARSWRTYVFIFWRWWGQGTFAENNFEAHFLETALKALVMWNLRFPGFTKWREIQIQWPVTILHLLRIVWSLWPDSEAAEIRTPTLKAYVDRLQGCTWKCLH
jgi:hypothetical protein